MGRRLPTPCLPPLPLHLARPNGSPISLDVRRLLSLILVLLPFAAPAQSLRATYEVHAAGMVILEVEARFTLGLDAYDVETRLRTRGLAATFVSGQQVSRVEGGWEGAAARPARYLSEGTWRGNQRRIALDWQENQPRVLDLTPPETTEREPVPPAMVRGTTDVLSAVATLVRRVGAERHCDIGAQVFDGRRVSEYAARSRGWETIPRWRGSWSGAALRCDFEGRQLAGFRRDQDRAEAAETQRGTAWLASPYAGAPAIPVRLDIPTRWFGTATVILLRAEPLQESVQIRR